MIGISLSLPGNVLHTEPQTLEFEKIATFIGGNGSGKSTILKSIFEEKLAGKRYQDYKIVCFSSGQNESYSKSFSAYLNKERLQRNALNLDCFYYDKLWSKLLIFLATTSQHTGLVRNFLKQNNYVVDNEFDEDTTTKLSFNVKVEEPYTKLVKEAVEDEEKGETDVITNKSYHQTLRSFINKLVSETYTFTAPLDKKNVQLTQDVLSKISFETGEQASFDSMVMFFTQAADNDYFIDKSSINLTFEKNTGSGGSTILGLEDLSDGEYQLLFLLALIDLFDTEETIFLLDEADSHLHYKNIDKIWSVFNNIQGRIITTTHLLDSITKSGIKKLKVIDNGQVKPGQKLEYLIDRLKELSEISNTQLQALSMSENIVYIDDENDWDIFKLLVIKKLADSTEEKLSIKRKLDNFVVIKQESSYQNGTEVFARSKLGRLGNFVEYLEGHPHKTKNVYLICDRDELQLTRIGTGKCDLLVKGDSINKYNNEKLTSHLLSWKRREIKHYLLSYTALLDVGNIASVENELDLGTKSKLSANLSGDYTTDSIYNDKLSSLKSDIVKRVIDPHINTHKQGFSIEKANDYINRIPKDEISEDIVNMYNYLASKND